MGKKREDRKKFEVPMEAKDSVGRIKGIPMLANRSEQEIYQVLKECNMDLNSATLRLHLQEMKRKRQEEEEEKQREGRDSGGATGESRAFPGCPKHEIKEGEIDSHNTIQRLLSQEKGKTKAGVPPEWKEQVERIKEIVKEKEQTFTEEEIYAVLRQCKMDTDLAAERLLANSLEEFEGVKSKWTKKKARINAQESKSRHKVSSSSASASASASGANQGGHDDDVGRRDTAHDNTVQGIQEVLSNARSQLDNFSSPPAAAVSSVASQSHHLNIGKGKVKKVVQSTDDNTATVSRSHVPFLHASGPLGIHASRAGSDVRAPTNNVANSSRNDSGKFPSALGGSSTTRNQQLASRNNVANSSRNDSGMFPAASGRSSATHNWNKSEFNDKRSIRGPQTCATLIMPSQPEKQEIPCDHAREAPANPYNPNSVSSGTLESELLPTSSELRALAEAGPSSSQRCSIQSIKNDLLDRPSSAFNHMTYSSMERPAAMSMNAPSFTPSASVHKPSQTQLRGNNFSIGHGFIHPYIDTSHCQPQLPLQHGYMNLDGNMHQNFGYDMTSPQQEVNQPQLPLQHGYMNLDGSMHQNFRYDMTSPQHEVNRRGSSSQANANPSSWGSFPGRGSTPHQFLPYSPAPSDSSVTQLNSALHVQAQRQHRNDYCPIGTNHNFAAWNNQPDPGATSAFPRQQQGGLPGWVPLSSDGNDQHLDMPLALPEVYQGGGSSRAASDWGSIQGTGSTSHQSLPNPPHSSAPLNNSWTSHDSTLQAQEQNRNDHRLSIFPELASTPHVSFPEWVPLPANSRNQRTDEASSPQYVCQGCVGCHHRGTRVRPNQQQQSLHNTSTGNLQDSSTMQPP